jgi:glycosyltransferase involved in cell wall biosynthesis
MKVAIIHYWLVGMRGGEKVVEALLDLYPQADIYTHVFCKQDVTEKIAKRVIGTTFIQKLPKSLKFYQTYLPLMPYALEQLDLSQYDLIISSESGPAKGVITTPDAIHICYCHSPMRYVWDLYHEYKKDAGNLKRILIAFFMHHIRLWDLASSYRVDYFIANSTYVNSRIKKFYRRKSQVIFPPVETSLYSISKRQVGDFYLIVAQLVGYKNTRLAIEAFNENSKKLIIIGTGPEYVSLNKIAKKNIVFLGNQSFESIKTHFSICKALIFPGLEDFGMVPVEAMASGRPVIAFAKGGALDTIVEGKTGVFFNEPTVSSLNNAIMKFENCINEFVPSKIREHALKFDTSVFKKQFLDFVELKIDESKSN